MRHNKAVLFFLIILFVAPGFLAYVFYLNPSWLGNVTTNQGVFLPPNTSLHVFPDKHVYRMVLWNEGACNQDCIFELDKIARVRLALGRRYYDVESWLLQGEHSPVLSSEVQAGLLAQDIHIKRLNEHETEIIKPLEHTANLFIVAPNQHFILGFKQNSKPDEIFHDLKHLLTTDKTSN